MEKSGKWNDLAADIFFLIDYQEKGRSLPEDREAAAAKMDELAEIFREVFGVTFSREPASASQASQASQASPKAD